MLIKCQEYSPKPNFTGLELLFLYPSKCHFCPLYLIHSMV